MTPRTLNNQDGIALGPILFIIAILAILAGAIAAGAGGFTANTNNDGAKASAHAIMQFSDQVAGAVQRVMAENGCLDTQVNFNNPIVSGYANPNAPIDHSCDIFDPRGGGLVFVNPPAGTTRTNAKDDGTYDFLADEVSGWGGYAYCIGSCTQELMIELQVAPAVADALRTILGQSTFISSGGSHNGGPNAWGKWAGNYSVHGNGINDGGGGGGRTKSEAIFCEGACSSPAKEAYGYYYYKVIILR